MNNTRRPLPRALALAMAIAMALTLSVSAFASDMQPWNVDSTNVPDIFHKSMGFIPLQ